MTDGHKHRMVRVASFDSRLVKWLRKPVVHSTDYIRVDKSPYPYGPCDGTKGCPHRLLSPPPDCWVLTRLSVLHRWTGLTLYVEGP